ncbi:hypothetical protein FPV67DRAFT_1679823 [Lyophyllum atratum]|nr:hypothetical protein FPV67DRAFT_1679823 [Lyophyllum atratum]
MVQWSLPQPENPTWREILDISLACRYSSEPNLQSGGILLPPPPAPSLRVSTIIQTLDKQISGVKQGHPHSKMIRQVPGASSLFNTLLPSAFTFEFAPPSPVFHSAGSGETDSDIRTLPALGAHGTSSQARPEQYPAPVTHLEDTYSQRVATSSQLTEAEERGRVHIEQVLANSLRELAMSGPVVPDTWDDPSDDEEGLDYSGVEPDLPASEADGFHTDNAATNGNADSLPNKTYPLLFPMKTIRTRSINRRLRLRFLPRTHKEQAELMHKYQSLPNETRRKAFIKEFATRYCEFAHLPYFDVCRMIVVDPMHNLILGLVKTHFYNIWMRLPSYLGRLPAMMGEPAGGSLTADQWLVAATIVCPLIIPQIWDEYCPEHAEAELRERQRQLQPECASRSQTQRRSGRKQKITARAAYVGDEPDPSIMDAGAIEPLSDNEFELQAPNSKRQQLDGDSDDEENEAEPAIRNMHPQDPKNFFRLSAALKLLLSHKLTDGSIDAADALLRQYGMELIEVYLYISSEMKCNMTRDGQDIVTSRLYTDSYSSSALFSQKYIYHHSDNWTAVYLHGDKSISPPIPRWDTFEETQ